MSASVQRPFSLPKPWIVALALGLAALIGVVDFVTGRDLALSAFYLVPICWAAWSVGRKAGISVAAASVVVWFIADLKTGYNYPHRLIPYWNALTLLVLFVFVIYLLSAFQAAHHHLEETVQSRTAALQAEISKRKRLEVAKLQAERLAVVGTMAAQVAHEVRNPLGSITLNLDLIHKEIAKLAETSRYPAMEGHLLVDEMRAETRRIQRVIEDYLRFARLPKPQRRPLVLNKLLDQKVVFMQSTLEQAGVKVRTKFAPEVTTINADAEQLWQAILNLIRNSREAMPNGGILTVSTERDAAQVLVRIADTGKGLTEEQMRQLFVPFFTTKAEGTGLGLALVQQIISEHGGHVECQSVIGQGSMFTLFLPWAEEKS